MKKNLFTLAVLLMMLAAPMMAQPQDQVFRMLSMVKKSQPVDVYATKLDSICIVSRDESPLEKIIFEYDDAGRVNSEHHLAFCESMADFISTEKHLFFYGDDGMLLKDEYYRFMGDDFMRMAAWQVTEVDATTGLPQAVIYSERSMNLMLRNLQPVMKISANKYCRDHLEDSDIYVWQSGEWLPAGSAHEDYDNHENKIGETVVLSGNISGAGMDYEEIVTYEYDHRQNMTRKTDEKKHKGQLYSQTETLYENHYDSADRLSEVLTIGDGELPTVGFYYWNDGTTTLVTALPRAFASGGGFVDLNGRRHSAAPSRRGLYIVGGRNVAY